MTDTVVRGRLARGAGGASRLKRAYRRSPLHSLRTGMAHLGLSAADVFVASYPRSGNAWLRFALLEMVGQHGAFDAIHKLVPYVGIHRGAPHLAPGGARFIKTHEPYRPEYRRAIYFVRDPRDVCLSSFRYVRRAKRLELRPTDDLEATFDRFVDAFIAGHIDSYGTWQSNVLSWKAAHDSGSADVLMLRYEDMRADDVSTVERIAEWLGLDLAPGEIDAVAQRCSLENMRESEQIAAPGAFGSVDATVAYMGPASLGSWHTALTRDQQHRFAAFARGIDAYGYEAPA